MDIDKLKLLINDGKTIFEITCILNCCKSTIKNYIKQLGIKPPKGFYSTGRQAGRKKGFKHTEEWKSQHKERMSGEKNPFYGKKHTNTAKEKMSENHADISGYRNPFSRSLLDENKRIRHKKRKKEWWNYKDKDYRDKFGRKISESLAKSKNTHNRYKNHKYGFFESDKCGKVFYRSSWEKLLCELLFIDDDVFRFTLEEFCIPYEINNDIRFTRIDFLVYYKNRGPLLIEVKPTALQSYGNNPEKIIGIEKYCKRNKIEFKLMGLDEINQYKDKLIEQNIRQS